VAVIGAALFMGVGVVNAQAPTPGTPSGSGMGGSWMMGGDTPMSDYMHAALADKLGLTVAELEAKEAEGVTAWQIAEAQGLTVEEFRAMMLEARTTALAQMVADGTITQEQADWMSQRGAGSMGARGGCPTGETGPGTMMRGNGNRGGGMRVRP
ncbi:MAG: hypothetical protein JW987_15030, partial [Anaerolineaceae bacterium]|nr:hypothetical protein [Anaerolineaceae bacterium]